MKADPRLGWIPDLPDQRDYRFRPGVGIDHPRPQPDHVDLRNLMPPVYDQSRLGSCTANGIAACVDFERQKQGLPLITPSRLFIYFNEREMEGTITADAGASIRDGIKSVAHLGVPPESDWPYDIARFTERPPDAAYAAALHDLTTTYFGVEQKIDPLLQCLADGFPFVFGFSVFDSFDSIGPDGRMPMPSITEQLRGGHCVVGCGYDKPTKLCLCRNSWSETWGDGGYFYMPFDFLADRNLANDFWTIRMVTQT